MLGDDEVTSLAESLAGAQVQQVAAAMRRVLARASSLRCAVVAGRGAFIP